MNRTRETELIRMQSLEVSEKSRFCPDAQVLAEFFQGALGNQHRDRIERHIADCPYCRSEIGMLERVDADHTVNEIPADVLASAKKLGKGARTKPSRVRRLGIPISIGVAAALAMIFIAPRLAEDPASSGSPAPVDSRELRGLPDAPADSPAILSPAEGSMVDVSELQIEWTPMPGALFYELQVMSEGGEILFDQRVEGTQWGWEADRELIAGRDYYLRVVAHLDDGRELKSAHTRVQAEASR